MLKRETHKTYYPCNISVIFMAIVKIYMFGVNIVKQDVYPVIYYLENKRRILYVLHGTKKSANESLHSLNKLLIVKHTRIMSFGNLIFVYCLP